MVPDVGRQARLVTPTASVAVGMVYAIAAPEWEVASNDELAGMFEIAGAIVSWTVTLKVVVAVLLDESVAVQVTVVCVIGNVEPDAGAQTTGTGPKLLLAVGAV